MSNYRKVLNIAEKPKVARRIAEIISNHSMRTESTQSTYNPVYAFPLFIGSGEKIEMFVTSVSGNIMDFKFVGEERSWKDTDPVIFLKEKNVQSTVIDSAVDCVENLKYHAKNSHTIILWLDCDREGEAIAGDCQEICKSANPKAVIKRARFSSLDVQSINRALQRLDVVDIGMVNSVFIRREIDLRVGSAFTRLQTVAVHNALGKNYISKVPFGSCQIPILSILLAGSHHMWSIQAELEGITFVCTSNFDSREQAQEWASALTYKQATITTSKCTIEDPEGLNTLGLQTQAIRKLGISAAEASKAAESLYLQGCISYPRTNSQSYSSTDAIRQLSLSLIQFPEESPSQILNPDTSNSFPIKELSMMKKPVDAHPAIHPLKEPAAQGNEKEVFGIIKEHFEMSTTRMFVKKFCLYRFEIDDFTFEHKRTAVELKSEVYTHCPILEGQIYFPKLKPFRKQEGFIGEDELLEKIYEYSLGTPSTAHNTIEGLINSKLVARQEGNRLSCTPLGLALVNFYRDSGQELNLSHPAIRKSFENDLEKVAKKQLDHTSTLNYYLDQYTMIFNKIRERMPLLVKSIAELIPPSQKLKHCFADKPFVKFCNSCNGEIIIRLNGSTKLPFLGCSKFPACTVKYSLPRSCTKADYTEEACVTCNNKKILLSEASLSFEPIPTCIFCESIPGFYPAWKSSSSPSKSTGQYPNSDSSSSSNFIRVPKLDGLARFSQQIDDRGMTPNWTDCAVPTKLL